MLTLTLSNQYLLTYTCIYTLNVLCVHTDQHNKFAYPSYLLFSVNVIKINNYDKLTLQCVVILHWGSLRIKMHPHYKSC